MTLTLTHIVRLLRCHAVALVFALSTCSALAQDAVVKSPSSEQRFETPPAPPLDMTKKQVSIALPRRLQQPALAQAGALKDLRVISLRAGQAEVSVGDGPAVTIRRGSVIAGDTVKEVGDRTIVMTRPETGGGESLVIVTQDSKGHSIVRVVTTKDPGASNVKAPPAVQ